MLPTTKSSDWEWWAVSGVIGRWSWFYLHIYAAKHVYFWIVQRRLAWHWGAGVIHACSRRGYLKKISWIELCMFDKGFGGRQYQKTTLRLRILLSTTSCEGAVVVFVRNSPEYPTPWTQSESNSATYEKTEVRNSQGFRFEVRKILLKLSRSFNVVWILIVFSLPQS